VFEGCSWKVKQLNSVFVGIRTKASVEAEEWEKDLKGHKTALNDDTSMLLP